MTRKTPEIIECDKIDIAEMCEAEQMTFYASLLTRITIHKNTLKKNGVKVLSAMENIPDTPEGIILESLLEGMNQYYPF